MRQKVSDFLNVDLARLSVAGWLLMLASLGIVVGGIALFAMAAPGGGADGAAPPRWAAYLAWVAAALFFFGGRWALEALGVAVYRRPPEPQQQSAPARDVAGRVEQGSAGGRIALGIACALIGAAFAALAVLYGDIFAEGRWLLYGLAAVCAVIAWACLVPRKL